MLTMEQVQVPDMATVEHAQSARYGSLIEQQWSKLKCQMWQFDSQSNSKQTAQFSKMSHL